MPNNDNNPQTGIITRRYKHGSVVYFEGDKSEYIYILKSGNVVLTSVKIDTGEEVKENIKIGEFFGVKSALGKYPREETAQTGGETVLLVLPRVDFERLILRKVDVVMKMLRVFSNQLRRVGKMQREVLGETDTINPAIELFKIGEYYYKIQKFQQALYAYKRYMEHFPDTKFSSVAMDRIKAIETGTADLDFVDEMGLEDAGKQEEAVVDEDVDLTDFSIDDDSEDGIDNDIGSNKKSPIAGEIDEFFSDDTDFSFDEPEAEENGKAVNNIAENYYNAVSLFSQEKYGEALDLYEQILKIKTLKDESERKIFEKANFEIGRIYLKLGKYNEAFKSLSDMIKKFPKSDNMKNALLHIGMTFELAPKHDKAISYYNKVISIEPRDEITNQAMKRLKNIKK